MIGTFPDGVKFRFELKHHVKNAIAYYKKNIVALQKELETVKDKDIRLIEARLNRLKEYQQTILNKQNNG